MKTPRSHPASRGSALVAVIFLVTIMSLLTASILSYSISERRANERQRLLLRARNMAENIALYASEQVTTKLYRLRSTSPIEFISGNNKIYLPPNDVLTTSFSQPGDVELHAGLTSTTGLAFIDPSDPANATNPNVGLQASTSSVPIIAKSTMSHPAVGAVTAYAQQDLQVALIPLFQFAIFYNQDLEFSPGADMVIAGPVHANGNFIARSQSGFSNTIQFRDRVTASGGFYADTGFKGSTYNEYGGEDSGPGGTGPLLFQNPAGTVTNIKSNSGTWRDHKYGNSNVSSTTLNQFKSFSTSTYGGNLRTSVHGVTPLVLPGVDESGGTNAGRSIIEAPSSSDTAGVKQTKFARNAGLYIIVNPDDNIRTGKLPDASSVLVLPFSYRCWLNTVNDDGTYTLQEVVLPGQPSYGYDNNGTPGNLADDTMYQNDFPNRFTDRTAIGSNQVLRIPASGRACDNTVSTFVSGAGTASNLADATVTTGYTNGSTTMGSFSDAYFFDLRRADNSKGYPFNRSSSNPFDPRPISKIDFDMTRLKLAVERTVYGWNTSSNIYLPVLPASANWGDNILNPSAGTTTVKLGYNGSTTFPTNTSGDITCDPFKLYFTSGVAVTPSNLINTSLPCPWFDGITIYVHSVDAEVKNGTRTDSGVRLWNGRGPVISLSPGTYPGRTGLSFATNDAAYIVGHFNTHGTPNTNPSSTSNPGGYAARYPDNSSEMLVSVMADAITILSQPEFKTSSSKYFQTSGWCDALSSNRRDSSNWSSSWFKSNPSSGNRVDGVNTSIVPAKMPNLSVHTSGAFKGDGSSMNKKFSPTETEISACMLTGIVPTDSHQTSGGVHNYPRLLEQWSGTGLYIRGSMVAMFDSEVATEPWSIRVYTGAGRYWGLHQNLRDAGHDVPLEPVVLNAQRLHYKEINAAEFATLKTTIQALPD